jgi:hypothetical protein
MALKMPLFLAMSCLQARGQRFALGELLKLEPDGVQLTPDKHFPEEDLTKTGLQLVTMWENEFKKSSAYK